MSKLEIRRWPGVDAFYDELGVFLPSNRQAARLRRAGGMDCARQGRSTRHTRHPKAPQLSAATRALEAISKSDGPRCPFPSRTVVTFYKGTATRGPATRQ